MNNLNHTLIDDNDMMDHTDSLFDQFEGSKA